MSRTGMRSTWGMALCAVACVVGCGSTVAVPSRPAGAGLAGPAAGMPGPAVGASPGVGGPGLPAGSRTAGAGAAPAVTLAARRPTGGGAGAAGPTAGLVATAPGITATKVLIGVVVTNTQSYNAFLNSFGANGLTRGDLHLEQTAVTSYINAHGGVAGGRRIQLVEHEAQVSNSQQTESQAACATWTEDHHVFAAVVRNQVELPVAASCLASRHTPLIQTGFDPGDAQQFAQWGDYYYSPGGVESVTMARAYVDGLVRRGFFGPHPRIGVLYYSATSLAAAYQQGLVPALSAYGLKVTDSAEIQYPTDNSQDGGAVAAVQNAALKFRADGIDHVLFLDAGAGLAFFFMKQAQGQHYTPRYGFETGSNPQFLEQNFDSSQLGSSLAVGWMPAADVDPPDFPASPARSLCRRIMHDARQDATSADDLIVQLQICSAFFFLKAALDRASSLTVAGFAAAAASLRTAPGAAAGSIAEGYGPGRHWGARAYRELAYDPACRCFRYLPGPAHTLP